MLAIFTTILLSCELKAINFGGAAASIDLANAKTIPVRIISEALCTFPSDTEFIEYDHTKVVRDRPSYESLRRKLDGGDLERLKIVLQTLGIDVRQIEEQVIGMSASSSLYGVISGDLVQGPARNSKVSPVDPRFADRIFCPGERICVAFFSDSLAGFADLVQLRRMIGARQSQACGRSAPNRELAELLKSTDQDAPVRGAALTGQLTALLGNLFPVLPNGNAGMAVITPRISGMAYSARFDSAAHVTGMLACGSRTNAFLFTSAVWAARSLGSRSAQIPTSVENIALQDIKLAPSGSVVTFRLDTTFELDR